MAQPSVEIKRRRRNIFVCEIQCKASTLTWSDINNVAGALNAKRIRYEAQAGVEIIRMISIWFSGGCQNYIHLKAKYKGEQIIPVVNDDFSSEGLVGDDVRYPFPIDQEMSRGEEFSIEYTNTDPAFDHTVVATLEIEQRFRDTTEDANVSESNPALKHETKNSEKTAQKPAPAKKPDLFDPLTIKGHPR